MRTRQALIHEDLAGDNNSGKEISIMSGENTPQVNSEIFYPESRTKRSPFDCSDSSTRTLMGQMCIAMILLGGVGIYRYGLHAAMVLAVTSVGSILTELVIGFLMKRGNTTGDCSAAVSGLILGLLLPPMIPLRYALLGAAVSMAVKNLSGGIGKNIVNPALCGKFFLLLVFRSAVSDYSCAPYGPISILTEMTSGQNVQILPMLTGDCASDIGTGSAAAVLLVTALLVILGVTDILIPISAVIFFVIVLILFGGHGWNPVYLGAHICGGGFLFLASFSATDYTTSPVTIRGRALYGALFGVLTAAARLRLGFDENGALFALLIMNLLARPIDRITMPRPFGSPQKRTTTVIDNKRKS